MEFISIQLYIWQNIVRTLQVWTKLYLDEFYLPIWTLPLPSHSDPLIALNCNNLIPNCNWAAKGPDDYDAGLYTPIAKLKHFNYFFCRCHRHRLYRGRWRRARYNRKINDFASWQKERADWPWQKQKSSRSKKKIKVKQHQVRERRRRTKNEAVEEISWLLKSGNHPQFCDHPQCVIFTAAMIIVTYSTRRPTHMHDYPANNYFRKVWHPKILLKIGQKMYPTNL